MLGPADFLGDWRVDRAIADRLSGRDGRFEGAARFTPEEEEGLRYREEGWLRLGDGAPLAASREYLWRFTPQGVEVAFPDGRPFHRFAPAGRGPGTDHPCGADLYRVAYDFAPWPSWTATWEVTGPRKAYRLATAYRR